MVKKVCKSKFFSGVLSFIMIIILLNGISVTAEDEDEPYPYTIFAASDKEGAVSVDADNFCLNGNVATNGTIVSTGNVNINGTSDEHAGKNMIYIFNKIDASYFSDNNVETHNEAYLLEEMNIHITNPLAVEGDTTLIGNINISSALKAFGDITLQGEVKNTNDSIIFSKYGDIVIDSQNVNINGLLYAPFGEVHITAQNLTLNNVVIIADTVVIHSPSVNANASSSMAEFVGNTSEKLNIPTEEWEYLPDENGDGIPDILENTETEEDTGTEENTENTEEEENTEDKENTEENTEEENTEGEKELKDTDGDFIPDETEMELGSNPNEKDTDGDGLDDFYELAISLTDLTASDSDGNKIPDGDEDLDDDGLTNQEEYELGTHPLYADSDGDELSDYEEVYSSLTNPNKKDTDGDGADDKWEYENGFDANVYDASFHVLANATGKNIAASVSMDLSGSQVRSLSVEADDDILFLDDTVPGYIGSPFRFEVDGGFEQATLSFTFPSEYLKDEEFVPTIYYYNEETQLLEELATTVIGNVATAVTTHFSVYVLLNKTTYENAWQKMMVPDNESKIDRLNIAFVLDTSGSMRGVRINTAKAVISNFVENVRGNDIKTEVALIQFSSGASVECSLTDDYDKFLNKLDNIGTSGSTAIYKGLNMGISELRRNISGHVNGYNAIILLTDGIDKASVTVDTYQQIALNALAFNIKIHTVGIEAVNERLLMALADATGGEYFYADEVAQLYEIYEELRTGIIDYTTDSNNDGISDYYTRLLCDGTLRIGTQCDIFNGVSYEDFNKDNDYDKDGKKNGEEFEIRHDSKTNRVYVYLHSNPIEPDSDFDGVDDSTDDDPWDAETGFLIYETEETDVELKKFSMAERPEDYQYSDKSIDEIRSMKYINWTDFFLLDEDYYRGSFKSLMKLCSTGEMEDVAVDMANHFLDGTGSDYSNAVLTKNIASHENTDIYVEGVKNIINNYIQENNGDISGLAYVNGTEEERMQGEMAYKMWLNHVYEPYYNDKVGGLGICIHGLYGNRFEIVSYKFDGNNYEYTLRFTFYDIFGLDSHDIEGDDSSKIEYEYGILQGFRSWYILQHCNLYGGDYQPYISYMTFERTMKGSIK